MYYEWHVQALSLNSLPLPQTMNLLPIFFVPPSPLPLLSPSLLLPLPLLVPSSPSLSIPPPSLHLPFLSTHYTCSCPFPLPPSPAPPPLFLLPLLPLPFLFNSCLWVRMVVVGLTWSTLLVMALLPLPLTSSAWTCFQGDISSVLLHFLDLLF